METLMKLNYKYNALEPYIDAETMETHHSKHHQGYVNKFNAAIEKYSELKDKSVEEILKNLNNIPKEIKQKIINNGGGVFNHNFFFSILKKEVPFNKDSEIGKAILEKFETLENFQKRMTDAATTQFGSGWAWLVLNQNNELEIVQTNNQDSPISQELKPIIAIDVWEHAYYLKYKNARAEYIKNFWNVICWDSVNEIYSKEKQ
jgi:superoxide dismutase, Fe-Mn family